MSKIISIRINENLANDLDMLFNLYFEKLGIKVNRNAFYRDAIAKYGEEAFEALKQLPYRG